MSYGQTYNINAHSGCGRTDIFFRNIADLDIMKIALPLYLQSVAFPAKYHHYGAIGFFVLDKSAFGRWGQEKKYRFS